MRCSTGGSLPALTSSANWGRFLERLRQLRGVGDDRRPFELADQRGRGARGGRRARRPPGAPRGRAAPPPRPPPPPRPRTPCLGPAAHRTPHPGFPAISSPPFRKEAGRIITHRSSDAQVKPTVGPCVAHVTEPKLMHSRLCLIRSLGVIYNPQYIVSIRHAAKVGGQEGRGWSKTYTRPTLADSGACWAFSQPGKAMLAA